MGKWGFRPGWKDCMREGGVGLGLYATTSRDRGGGAI